MHGLQALLSHADPAEKRYRWVQEEALAVAGESEPSRAAKAVLDRPQARAQWVVIKLGGTGSQLHTSTHVVSQPAFQVSFWLSYCSCDGSSPYL